MDPSTSLLHRHSPIWPPERQQLSGRLPILAWSLEERPRRRRKHMDHMEMDQFARSPSAKTNEHPNIAGSCGSSGSSFHPNMGIIRCWSAIRMARLGPGLCLFFFGPTTWSNVSHVSSEEVKRLWRCMKGERGNSDVYIYIIIYINDMIWYDMMRYIYIY